jgi:hypothetical protein
VLDRQALGLSPGKHVISHFRERLTAQGCPRAIDLATLPTPAPTWRMPSTYSHYGSVSMSWMPRRQGGGCRT